MQIMSVSLLFASRPSYMSTENSNFNGIRFRPNHNSVGLQYYIYYSKTEIGCNLTNASGDLAVAGLYN